MDRSRRNVGTEMKKMKALTALIIVGAVLIGAVIMVPLSMASDDAASMNGTSSANGDCVMDQDQLKDGSCDQCDGDQDMIRQQDRTAAKDGSCGECCAADGTCDRTTERARTQDGSCDGQMVCTQLQEQAQTMTQLQERSCTMTKAGAGAA